MGVASHGLDSRFKPIGANGRDRRGDLLHSAGQRARAADAEPSAHIRSSFLRLGASGALAGLAWSILREGSAQAGGKVYCDKHPSTPADALAAVKAGNELWVSGKQHHPGEDATRRAYMAQHGQTTFAAILSCAVADVFDGDAYSSIKLKK